MVAFGSSHSNACKCFDVLPVSLTAATRNAQGKLVYPLREKTHTRTRKVTLSESAAVLYWKLCGKQIVFE